MRELAPILTGAEIIPAMREAIQNHQMLEYRQLGKRKHGAVDLTSCNTIIQVYDGLNQANKEKLLHLYGDNPGTLATAVWFLIRRSKK